MFLNPEKSRRERERKCGLSHSLSSTQLKSLGEKNLAPSSYLIFPAQRKQFFFSSFLVLFSNMWEKSVRRQKNLSQSLFDIFFNKMSCLPMQSNGKQLMWKNVPNSNWLQFFCHSRQVRKIMILAHFPGRSGVGFSHQSWQLRIHLRPSLAESIYPPIHVWASVMQRGRGGDHFVWKRERENFLHFCIALGIKEKVFHSSPSCLPSGRKVQIIKRVFFPFWHIHSVHSCKKMSTLASLCSQSHFLPKYRISLKRVESLHVVYCTRMYLLH